MKLIMIFNLILSAVTASPLAAKTHGFLSSNSIRATVNLKRNFAPPKHRAAATCFHVSKTGNDGLITIVKKPLDGGIKEDIAKKFQQKYQKWKSELLSTEFGRQQWKKYQRNPNFVLTVTVSGKSGHGAGTEKYQWDENGNLIGATIVLGSKIDSGFPSPAYFPIMNSLAINKPLYRISGEILAAAKFAHEFGHINLTEKTNSDLFVRQNKLMPVYNSILLENGYDTTDQRLLELVSQMGGTPVEVWENREYWGEANAMLFLLDRINRENFYCQVFSKMRRNVKTYAQNYEERFIQINEPPQNSAAFSCGN